MRVLVTGGRDYKHRDNVFRALDMWHAEEPITELIAGGARGADFFAKQWAIERSVRLVEVEAEWDLYGNAAGPIRNQKMVDMRPDMVVAFPGGTGTDDCVRRAHRARVCVVHS